MICRLCLSCEGFMNSILDVRLQILEKIEYISSIKILISDGLPATICVACTQKVESFHIFKKQIETSNDTLRKWVGVDATKKTKQPATITSTEEDTSDQVETADTDVQIELAPRVVETQTDDPSSPTYSCLICLEKFKTKGLMLLSHSKTHFGKKGKFQNKPPFKCEMCLHCFDDRLSFVVHQRAHFKVKPFNCKTCKRKFGDINILKDHTGNDECAANLLSCDDCGKLFKLQIELDDHEKWHSAKPFKCELCHKELSSIQSYRIHMKYHINGKFYTCSICNKSYYTASHLKQHQITHNMSLPHQCRMCDKSFYTERELNKHLKYHYKKKAHKCKYCSQVFYEMHHLKEHFRLVHENERIFECEKCGKFFQSENRLKQHIKNHPITVVENTDPITYEIVDSGIDFNGMMVVSDGTLTDYDLNMLGLTDSNNVKINLDLS